ncbi:hypothetical protein [Emticicia soli]|uniref:DoxX family protein n=1 Tax=Emticicia soli TaxID=2027878 RepID=A0ABW5JBL2_9BACT
MIKNIISLALLLASAGLNFKHGLDAFKTPTLEQQKMISQLGLNESGMKYIGIFSILIAVLQLIPKTFFLGNLLNAFVIITIMAFAIKAENYRMVLIEIPFLIMPLVMIWLKYPFKS